MLQGKKNIVFELLWSLGSMQSFRIRLESTEQKEEFAHQALQKTSVEELK